MIRKLSQLGERLARSSGIMSSDFPNMGFVARSISVSEHGAHAAPRTGRSSSGECMRAASTVASVIYDALVQRDVPVVFGYSGGTVLPLLDQFARHNGTKNHIRFVKNSHEQFSGFAAAGYARSSGKPGVCCVTSGPGLTNAVTPLLDSLNDGVPLLLFSGQVATTARPDAFQASPAVDITRPCTKWSHQISSADEVHEMLNEAFRVATSGRPGPVHIDCPVDVLNAQTPTIAQEVSEPQASIDLREMSKNVDSLFSMLARAKKPLVIVGRGASQCSDLVRDFISKANIPFVTTVHGKGVVPDNHPLSLRMVGMHGHAAANLAVQNADLIISLGSRFDDRTTGDNRAYAPVARRAQERGAGGIFHVDIRGSEKDKQIKSGVFVQGNLKTFLQLTHLKLDGTRVGFDPSWYREIQGYIQNNPPYSPSLSNTHGISVQAFCNTLNEVLREQGLDPTITTGVGVHQMVAAQRIDAVI